MLNSPEPHVDSVGEQGIPREERDIQQRMAFYDKIVKWHENLENPG